MAVEVTDYRAHRLLSGKDAQNSFFCISERFFEGQDSFSRWTI